MMFALKRVLYLARSDTPGIKNVHISYPERALQLFSSFRAPLWPIEELRALPGGDFVFAFQTILVN